MNILIIFINNPNAITKGGKYDIRYSTFRDIAYYLKKKKYNVYATPCDIKSKLTKDVIQNFKPFSKSIKYDICLCWYPRKNRFNAKKMIFYENGFLKNSIIVDPKGLLSESKYIDNLNQLVENNYNQQECNKYITNILTNNFSKRLQKNMNDIPSSINKKYVFLPTQKANDISIRKHSNISMFDCIEKTSIYCKKHNIPLVVKIHPHLGGTELQEQINFCTKLGNIHLSKSSINQLIQNARFTVCLNGGTLIDNFVNGSPILSLAKSMFYKTDAVIFNEDIHKGLDIMINKKYNLEKMLDKQRKVIWWIYNNSLFYDKSIEFNIKVLEYHLSEKI